MRSLGGTDRKIMVNYDNKNYMLKFSENHSKRTDLSTSNVNNVISEYISSHIAQSTGIPTHNTVLGTYNNEIVVGCEDFRKPDDENIEFGEFIHSVYDSKDIKRVIRLDQIYKTLEDKTVFSEELKKASIERYWDTFVIDSFVGNFDRHMGNWGYIANNNKLSLAPMYDFGSTLLPQLGDDGWGTIINDEYELTKRCMVFPSPALFISHEKSGKVGYYDLLSSNYDKNCTEAVIRTVPKIKMDTVERILDNTPFITNKRRESYKRYLNIRYDVILKRAYDRCVSNNFDKEAFERIINGIQYSDKNLIKDFNVKPNKSLNINKDIKEFHAENGKDNMIDELRNTVRKINMTNDGYEYKNNPQDSDDFGSTTKP